MMNKGIYVLEVLEHITYIKGKDGLYVKTSRSTYKDVKPYIEDQRGIYLLVGKGRIYIGEGDVYKRLTRHTRDKKWFEDVYIHVRNDMTKEESLELEGALVNYMKNTSDYIIDNKDATRETSLSINHQVRVFKKLGLGVKNNTEELNVGNTRVVIRKTHVGTYRILTVNKETKEWLIGYEFHNKSEIIQVFKSLGGVINVYG